MEAINQIIKDRVGLAVGVAFAAGLLIGWMLLGWVIAPVKWVNASAAELNPVAKVEWVKMTADSLALNLGSDTAITTAQDRVAQLGDQTTAINDAIQFSEGVDQQRVAQLQQVLQGAGAAPGQDGGSAAPAEGESTGVLGGGALRALLIACGVIFLFGVLGAGGLYVLRRRQTGDEDGEPDFRTPAQAAAAATSTAEATDYSAAASGTPVAQFMTTYMLGDDLYDDSFSIDDAAGDFLGECGVAIGDTIGVGDPKKVAAFEVWLFDKNDIRTVTKVLMSEHGFMDEAFKSKLASKGEPLVARSGETLVLETATLNVTARIVDMQYGSGPLPPNSFFQQLTIELAAWKKTD
ncbi:MAG: hypothetical protein ACE5FI_02140 [Anaerolineales bacterium]